MRFGVASFQKILSVLSRHYPPSSCVRFASRLRGRAYERIFQKREYGKTTKLSDCLTAFALSCNKSRLTRVTAHHTQHANTTRCDDDNGAEVLLEPNPQTQNVPETVYDHCARDETARS